MRFKQPEIFLIAQTKPNDSEIARWLQYLGCDDETVQKYSSGKARITGGFDEGAVKTHGERIVELAGRRCYLAFQKGLNSNVQRIREDIAEYCTNILKQKHGSVLEHVYYSFAIEGVSRVFTGEMNRHRAGMAISEGSMRFIAYDDIPLTETPMLALTDSQIDDQLREYMAATVDDNVSHLTSLPVKKQRTRELFRECCYQIEHYYKQLRVVWNEELKPESKFKDKKHITSLLRRIIPMGVATGGVWTGNIRALRHLCTMRCAESAEEEICFTATKILEVMMREEPTLFGDFKQDANGFYAPVYEKV